MDKWNRLTSNKTKQLFHIIKWQGLAVSSHDNDKMDAIVQCRGIFYKFGWSGKDYVEAFNFRVQIKKDVKNVEEFFFFLLFFLGPFYLDLLLPTTTLNRGWRGAMLRRQT